jgi:hypothetical protein
MAAGFGVGLAQSGQRFGSQRVRLGKRAHQPLGAHRLQQVIHRIQLECLAGVGIVGRTENDRGGMLEFLQVLRALDAVHRRHADVEQDDVGSGLLDLLHCVETVVGLTDDFDRALRGTIFQHLAQTAARRRLVIDDEDARQRAGCVHGCTAD